MFNHLLINGFEITEKTTTPSSSEIKNEIEDIGYKIDEVNVLVDLNYENIINHRIKE